MMGQLLREQLLELKETPAIGDVRGQGLMIGVDVVKDPSTKDPNPETAARIAEGAKSRGVIVGRGGIMATSYG